VREEEEKRGGLEKENINTIKFSKSTSINKYQQVSASISKYQNPINP
jgi:hypothetical protein